MATPDESPRTPEGGVDEVDVKVLRRNMRACMLVSPRSSGNVKNVKRKLFTKEKKSQQPWTDEEIKSLIMFVMLHSDGSSWMTHKEFRFWNEAGSFIQMRVHSLHQRSGKCSFPHVATKLD